MSALEQLVAAGARPREAARLVLTLARLADGLVEPAQPFALTQARLAQLASVENRSAWNRLRARLVALGALELVTAGRLDTTAFVKPEAKAATLRLAPWALGEFAKEPCPVSDKGDEKTGQGRRENRTRKPDKESDGVSSSKSLEDKDEAAAAAAVAFGRETGQGALSETGQGKRRVRVVIEGAPEDVEIVFAARREGVSFAKTPLVDPVSEPRQSATSPPSLAPLPGQTAREVKTERTRLLAASEARIVHRDVKPDNVHPPSPEEHRACSERVRAYGATLAKKGDVIESEATIYERALGDCRRDPAKLRALLADADRTDARVRKKAEAAEAARPKDAPHSLGPSFEDARAHRAELQELYERLPAGERQALDEQLFGEIPAGGSLLEARLADVRRLTRRNELLQERASTEDGP